MMDERGCIFSKDIDGLGMPMGSSRQLNAIGGLSIVLMWYRTRGSFSRNLALLFGQICTPMYTWVKFSRRVSLYVLIRDIDSNIMMPSAEDVRFYNELICAKYPLCGDVQGATDGIKLLSEVLGDEIKQNRLYNSWTHGYYINCVFVFCPDGKI